MKGIIKALLQCFVGAVAIVGVLYSDDMWALFTYPLMASMLIALIREA